MVRKKSTGSLLMKWYKIDDLKNRLTVSIIILIIIVNAMLDVIIDLVLEN